MLAQEFELKTTEQLMLARQLNLRSKEVMTVARLRMMRENADRAKQSNNKLGLVSPSDMLRLGRMIESDAIRAEAYQERLDDVLSIGAEIDAGSASLNDAGEGVMKIWDQLDAGTITDTSAAFDEADRSVRKKHADPEA